MYRMDTLIEGFFVSVQRFCAHSPLTKTREWTHSARKTNLDVNPNTESICLQECSTYFCSSTSREPNRSARSKRLGGNPNMKNTQLEKCSYLRQSTTYWGLSALSRTADEQGVLKLTDLDGTRRGEAHHRCSYRREPQNFSCCPLSSARDLTGRRVWREEWSTWEEGPLPGSATPAEKTSALSSLGHRPWVRSERRNNLW
jgi:hypothetical protein